MFSFLKSGWRWLKKQCRKLVSEVKDTVVGTGKNKVRKEDSVFTKVRKVIKNTASSIWDLVNLYKLLKKLCVLGIEALKLVPKRS
ncbi:TPA: hypothetical protein VGT17_005535 [Vibrio harveyi]|nr:hypothetical protein [Vibrio harveyi]HEQ3599560.1 hypothetical protein [Vibrio harveyi]HEQ3611595.1 hypothetical protein [Vibrio harveyi]